MRTAELLAGSDAFSKYGHFGRNRALFHERGPRLIIEASGGFRVRPRVRRNPAKLLRRLPQCFGALAIGFQAPAFTLRRLAFGLTALPLPFVRNPLAFWGNPRLFRNLALLFCAFVIPPGAARCQVCHSILRAETIKNGRSWRIIHTGQRSRRRDA